MVLSVHKNRIDMAEAHSDKSCFEHADFELLLGHPNEDIKKSNIEV